MTVFLQSSAGAVEDPAVVLTPWAWDRAGGCRARGAFHLEQNAQRPRGWWGLPEPGALDLEVGSRDEPLEGEGGSRAAQGPRGPLRGSACWLI